MCNWKHLLKRPYCNTRNQVIFLLDPCGSTPCDINNHLSQISSGADREYVINLFFLYFVIVVIDIIFYNVFKLSLMETASKFCAHRNKRVPCNHTTVTTKNILCSCVETVLKYLAMVCKHALEQFRVL